MELLKIIEKKEVKKGCVNALIEVYKTVKKKR